MIQQWTEERGREAVEELSREPVAPGACKRVADRLCERWGFRVTADTMHKAFRRLAIGAPSSYLGGSRSERVCASAAKADNDRDTTPTPPENPKRREVLEQITADRTGYVVHHPPGPDVAALLARRKAQYQEKERSEREHALIRVDVKMRGPIGILHFGDPHVDDDGTDVAALERHTEIIQKTPGLFAGNVGDTTNNWVGRLARLYGQQSTSAEEAWLLAEWFVNRCKWLYMVAGNHDMWSGSGDPLKWIAAQSGALHKETNVRLELKFPNGRDVRVNVRHDFSGNSQWNPAHGSMKAAQFGARDHILVNGHKHISGYGIIRDPNSEIVSHCIQVASYKRFDRYAKERGFRDQTISPCAVTIIDPDASEASLVQTYWEPEPAAEFLTWLRQKRAA